jgi:hypothetical protein
LTVRCVPAVRSESSSDLRGDGDGERGARKSGEARMELRVRVEERFARPRRGVDRGARPRWTSRRRAWRVSSCAEGGDLLGEGRGTGQAARVRGKLVGEGWGRVLFALQSQVPRWRILHRVHEVIAQISTSNTRFSFVQHLHSDF